MSLSLELRTRLYNDGLLRRLRYDGPGRVAVSGPASSTQLVVRALSAACRPDLALAVIAAAPQACGAVALAAVLDAHADLVDEGLVPADAARAAVAGLPAPDVSSAAAASDDVVTLVSAVEGGDLPARFRLLEVLRGPGAASVLTPAGVRPYDGADVDPVLTWRLCAALWDVDRVLAVAVAEAFLGAVRSAVAVGVVAPERLTAEGRPSGGVNDPGCAAAALLLAERFPGVVPLDGTPAARGSRLDEEAFLAPARGLARDTEVAPGVTAGALLAEHARPHVPGIDYSVGVQYAEAEGVPLRMHLFRPLRAAAPAPTVVFIHGGGWESGSPAKFLRQAADWAAAGWVTASIGYRLVPQTVWPGPLLDVLAALRFLADNAESLGVDPQRVALVGNSAGGHLALLAAARDEAVATGVRISGVVAISPLTDTLWPALIPEGGRLVRRLVGGDEQLLADASPAAFVHPGMPPVLTVTGAVDTLTTPDMIRDYHRRLDEVGAPNELHVLPGRFHAFEFAPADSRWWSERALQWLSERFADERAST